MRKINIKSIFASLFIIAIGSVGIMFQSCDEYPNEYEITGGVPTVDYIRISDPEKSDSLIVSASLDQTIVLIGENLTSITELWFNDQKAELNTSFITSTALFVTIPTGIPEEVTDKIYMKAGDKTVEYDFNVTVPAPAPKSMLCEFVEDGDEAVIKGNYLIDDPNVPLQVFFPGNIEAEVVSVSDDYDEVTVIVPEGAGVGAVTVKSIYGSSSSTFYFRDDRNIFLDFDTKTAEYGWRSGVIASEGGIDGNYVKFSGTIPGDLSDWNEDAFSFNYWPASTSRTDDDGQILWDGDLSEAVLKFEINVTSAWSANALQMIFTPANVSGTNSYIADGSPRGLWSPWQSEGSYVTDGWETVSFPLSDFIYTHEGGISDTSFDNSFLSGLTFFVYHGGVEGTECTPTILIDNIRVVPE